MAATTHFSPVGAIFRAHAGIGSPSGRCATFSSSADGFLPSEGAVAIVIQRAADATSPTYARIRATAVSQDGRGRSFASPNMIAQARVIEMALKKTGCGPDDISYHEGFSRSGSYSELIPDILLHCSARHWYTCRRFD